MDNYITIVEMYNCIDKVIYFNLKNKASNTDQQNKTDLTE
jgi:hypothetical protein